jgi:hypothetical protein
MANMSPLEEFRETQRRLRRRWLFFGIGAAVAVLGFFVFTRVDRTDARIGVVTLVAVIGGVYAFAFAVAILAGREDRHGKPRGRWGRVVEWCRAVVWLP